MTAGWIERNVVHRIKAAIKVIARSNSSPEVSASFERRHRMAQIAEYHPLYAARIALLSREFIKRCKHSAQFCASGVNVDRRSRLGFRCFSGF